MLEKRKKMELKVEEKMHIVRKFLEQNVNVNHDFQIKYEALSVYLCIFMHKKLIIKFVKISIKIL